MNVGDFSETCEERFPQDLTLWEIGIKEDGIFKTIGRIYKETYEQSAFKIVKEKEFL